MAKITAAWDFLKQNNVWVGLGNFTITGGKAFKSLVEVYSSDNPSSVENKNKQTEAINEVLSLLPKEAGLARVGRTRLRYAV
jgi:hypothetical protein